MFKNPNSQRENPFRETYDNKAFKDVLRQRDKLPQFPFLVDVELTNHCNLKCIFCGQQAMTRDKGFMSEEIFKKVIDECSQHDAPVRFIRWGEPFLHPEIIDYCSYAKSKGILLHITNNGLAITESDMKSLVELEVDSIIFSFQGATQEQYELMRNNRHYDTLKANVLRLVELRGDKKKPYIHISSTMTNEPEKEIDEFVNQWGHIVDSVGTGKTNLSRLSAHQIGTFETIGKLDVLKKQETIKKCYRPCTEVYQKLSVDWDGTVTCCCGDFDNFLAVGNVNTASLFDIWNNSEELKIFRNLLDRNLHKSLNLCSTCYHTYEEF